ncbi:protein FMP32, mitochondrial-like isoform X2 [Andrographis paniculata]|uniref:protein FMP32, mitochondrial-like isoform X2 n=1 Tax=Andrographis paniculata TaxID=175694 RepID=UPI0021E745EF|nr:protein FMP32, mitochondrial-like isoform X2 [Andrographis paniculata]
MAAACRRVASGLCPPFRLESRQLSELSESNGKRVFFVDTLALVRRLESKGIPTKEAEAITATITEVLNNSWENASYNFVSKGEMQKNEMSLVKFRTELKSSQDHHFALLQHEGEKLRNDIEKMRSELRYEIDKVTAGQRLDLNLEKGRMRDELNNQNQEIHAKIHALHAQIEAAKYDVIKYCVGTVVSVCAVGLAVLRTLIFSFKMVNWT